MRSFSLALALVLVGACSQPDAPAPARETPPASPAPSVVPSPPPALAKPSTMAGTWIGTYAYPDPSGGPPREGVRFFAELREDAGAVTGTILEPNTFGDAGAKELRANVSGRHDSGGAIRFGKTYDSSGGVVHTVDYEGTLDASGTRIAGTWRAAELTGTFEMQRWGS